MFPNFSLIYSRFELHLGNIGKLSGRGKGGSCESKVSHRFVLPLVGLYVYEWLFFCLFIAYCSYGIVVEL